MEKVSPYYTNYIKGGVYSNRRQVAQIMIGVEFYKKAIEIRDTEEANSELLRCYAALNDVKNYVATAEHCVEMGFSSVYVKYANFLSGLAPIYEEYIDKDKALDLFDKAMKLKIPSAFSDLAMLYQTGTSVIEKDEDNAELLLRQGLKLNNPTTNGYFCHEIGRCLVDKEQYVEALEMFNKALEYNYKNAHYDIALLYKEGHGVEANSELYVEHLLKFLSPESAIELIGVYLTEKYAEQDLFLAEVYANYAASKGNSIAAILSAAFLLQKEQYDEKLVNNYLEIAFKNGKDDDELKSKYNIIEDALGTDVSKKLQELAEKYWNIKMNEA